MEDKWARQEAERVANEAQKKAEAEEGMTKKKRAALQVCPSAALFGACGLLLTMGCFSLAEPKLHAL